jgi:hypothetical protein
MVLSTHVSYQETASQLTPGISGAHERLMIESPLIARPLDAVVRLRAEVTVR